MTEILLTKAMFKRNGKQITEDIQDVNDFYSALEAHEIKRLGLKDGFCNRIQPILASTDNQDRVLEQGDIVLVFRERGEQIVVEHVATDVHRQEFLALKDLETGEICSMLHVLGKCKFVRKATEDEERKYHVWID